MEMESWWLMGWVFTALISIFLFILALKLVYHIWWTPRRIENHFREQGVSGPGYRFLLGNLKEIASLNFSASSQSLTNRPHNIVPRVLSFYHHWKKIYGSVFIVWFGPTPRLTISDPALVRDILIAKSEFFEKNESPPLVQEIEGDGLLSLKGEKWGHHRRTLQPAFHAENLKLMFPAIAKSVETAVAEWSEKMGDGGKVEVEVSKWFENLVEEVITRVTFGDTNYDTGRAIFQLQSRQMANAAEAFQKICFPGHRFLPTRKNRVSRRLEREIRDSLLKLIERRRAAAEVGCEVGAGKSSDFLDVMMGNGDLTAAEVAEECKTIFYAGKHTTANLLTWTTVLLGMHPHWQEQAREEVLRVCGARDMPTRDDLAKLKTMSMILYESLRLYPPVVAIIRRATRDVHLGQLGIPCGTELLIPILVIHHDPGLWPNDPHEFNPARFANGAAHAAKHPMALMPFGIGTRRCIGQNLAILHAKLAMTMILQKFFFEVAPSYQHAPSVEILLQPQHGAPIVFTKL